MSDNAITGYCPMGCGTTLFVGSGGYITCSHLKCPRPEAVSELLDDAETHHIVELGKKTFTVRHPLRERLGDALMDCQLHNYIAGLDGPPRRPGRYRVVQDEGRWGFVEVNTPTAKEGQPS